MKKEKYDVIVPIGAACLNSLYLRSHLLQKLSYPMDWVGGGDFIERIRLLCTDFCDYLDLTDLQDTGKTYVDRIGPCKVVKNRRTGIIFNHDFPGDISIRKSYPAIKEKYQRRIDRLRKVIDFAHKILILYIEENNRIKPLKDNALLIQADKMLQRKFPNKIVQLLYVSNDTQMLKGDKIDEQLSVRVRKITLNYQNEKESADWVPDWKALEKAIGYLRVRKPMGDFLYEKFLLTVSRIIIFRSLRRKFLRKCHLYV